VGAERDAAHRAEQEVLVQPGRTTEVDLRLPR
jgi:hypothetical protein